MASQLAGRALDVLAQRAKSKLLALPGSMPITGSMQMYFVYKFYLCITMHLLNNLIKLNSYLIFTTLLYNLY